MNCTDAFEANAEAPPRGCTVARLAVQQRVAALDLMLRSHTGGLALDGVGDDGVVRVRFTGMCTGCELKPHTAANVIVPALEALEGVRRVDIAGGRVSEHAQARLQATADPAGREAMWRVLEAIECEAFGGTP